MDSEFYTDGNDTLSFVFQLSQTLHKNPSRSAPKTRLFCRLGLLIVACGGRGGQCSNVHVQARAGRPLESHREMRSCCCRSTFTDRVIIAAFIPSPHHQMTFVPFPLSVQVSFTFCFLLKKGRCFCVQVIFSEYRDRSGDHRI